MTSYPCYLHPKRTCSDLAACTWFAGRVFPRRRDEPKDPLGGALCLPDSSAPPAQGVQTSTRDMIILAVIVVLGTTY